MNCLTYAFGKWLREGGYLLVRRSKLAEEFGITSKLHPASWVPHFLHRDHNHVVTQYTATDWQRTCNQQRGLFRTWLTLWHFKGVVVGDDKADK
jgi:hypothetical protein